MPILAFLSLLHENKKSSNKMLPPVGIEPGPLITSDSKSNTILSGLTWHLLVRLRLRSLYSHAPLIITNPLSSSKSKNQVVHEQKFKDLLSSTWLTSSERIVLDLESEVMRGLGSIPTWGNILSLEFFFVFTQ